MNELNTVEHANVGVRSERVLAAMVGARTGAVAGLFMSGATLVVVALAGASPMAVLTSWSRSVPSLGGGNAVVILTALALHVILGGAFGALYGLFSTIEALRSRFLVVRTLLAGSLAWLVTYQLFARFGAPALLQLPQLRLWVVCILFFGLPLASMLAGEDRRRRLVRTLM